MHSMKKSRQIRRPMKLEENKHVSSFYHLVERLMSSCMIISSFSIHFEYK